MKLSQGDTKFKSWYQNKYAVASVQKNILMLLTVVLLICLFFALLLVKYVYENRSITPYLIEVDSSTGVASVVDTQSIKEFTASEIIRESYVVKYLKARESYNINTIDEDKNNVRLMSSSRVYKVFNDDYTKSLGFTDEERSRAAKITVSMRSISFVTAKLAEVKITRNIVINEQIVRKVFLKGQVIFDFFDLDLDLDERYLNPLGFQVTGYVLNEEKVAKGYDLDKAAAQDMQNSSNSIAQNQGISNDNIAGGKAADNTL